jgi:L-lactate dehydrogenase complex protein LldG
VPLFDTPPGGASNALHRLGAMGGTCVEGESLDTVLALLAERFGADAIVRRLRAGYRREPALAPICRRRSLQDVDAGVVRARFGVAETGSVWFSEDEYIVNSMGYLVQHLVVLLDPAQIVDGLQDVYRRDFQQPRVMRCW